MYVSFVCTAVCTMYVPLDRLHTVTECSTAPHQRRDGNQNLRKYRGRNRAEKEMRKKNSNSRVRGREGRLSDQVEIMQRDKRRPQRLISSTKT